ncbi:unnamed protein product [Protopolystoma xenopodis]|uniref:Uncharacterized protein n=1 Tax=Protopolystoma xenopodis TaxID=117903 RepID=A0A3S5AGB0_9PLAT|nr:unnamed protein product [Protopolystoma xenopodis]
MFNLSGLLGGIWPNSPCVIFASHPSLRFGPAVHLIRALAHGGVRGPAGFASSTFAQTSATGSCGYAGSGNACNASGSSGGGGTPGLGVTSSGSFTVGGTAVSGGAVSGTSGSVSSGLGFTNAVTPRHSILLVDSREYAPR